MTPAGTAAGTAADIMTTGRPWVRFENEECRIDALAQAWSVLSEVAPPDRADQALAALEEHLVVEDPGLIKLLAPPFVDTPHDPGYIKGYVAGRARERRPVHPRRLLGGPGPGQGREAGQGGPLPGSA